MAAFHSGDVVSELEGVKLSDAEKDALLGVMQRAKQFDQQYSSPGTTLEGQLHKWTNPLKGWQPRWFCVDRQQGMLNYYMSEDRKKQAPRGSLQLWGAAISPSEEDSQSFSISDTVGEVYRLRAGDAKERQWWVSRLHREVELRTSQSFATPVQENLKVQSAASGGSRDQQQTTPTGQTTPSHSAARAFSKRLHTLSLKTKSRTHKSASPTPSTEDRQTSQDKSHERSHDRSHDQSRDLEADMPGGDAMLEVLMRLQCYQECLVAHLQLNCKQAGFTPTDKNALLLRATSQAAVQGVKDCLALLKLQQTQTTSLTTMASPDPSGHAPSLSSLGGGGAISPSVGGSSSDVQPLMHLSSRSGSTGSRKSAGT